MGRRRIGGSRVSKKEIKKERKKLKVTANRVVIAGEEVGE